ncbi:nucleotidyltransferase [Pseudoflavonifractor sp. 524-17]|uniref:tRNA(Met) cytidine acetate ligase n=1 Tax=Pseudoflavonifractor sp. 524-17 TaxID=2304577 RepID=UPI00137A9242|nr:nucleotidyltransferase family protein [Pseudoflavonifractor sp. 524-17]NCE64562.1 nucleotidyltransferase [Pseudoflavonifractor sp. 524-17]
MPVAGIVAEYNPFHTGHAYHIAQTRRLLGADTPVICAMSGNWVQRGECALADKWRRAAWALQGGADVVLELPTVWAVSSAERFAQGAVALLAATGVVDTLSFGSELGVSAPLRQAADCLNSPAFSQALQRPSAAGQPFALRRRQAVESLAGPAVAAVLDTPNNNLAVEYLRALPTEMRPLAIPRQGAAHDGEAAGGYASASLLRQWIRAGAGGRARPYLSAPWTGEPASMLWCERAILARLRSASLEELQALPDSGEGLAARLLAAARQAAALEQLYSLAKTKRYAHARIRRLALCAFLGIRQEDRPPAPLYLRVLGLSSRGRELLKQMRRSASLPVLVKPAHIRRLPAQAQALFALEERYTSLYGLCFPTPRPAGLEFTAGPVLWDGSA